MNAMKYFYFNQKTLRDAFFLKIWRNTSSQKAVLENIISSAEQITKTLLLCHTAQLVSVYTSLKVNYW